MLSVYVDNQAGVLSGWSGCFGQGFNIESFRGPDPGPTILMVITTSGNEQVLEQIKTVEQTHQRHQGGRLHDKDYVEREMILVKVKAEKRPRRGARIADIFRAKVIDVSPKSYTLSLTGDKSKLEGFIEILTPIGILDFVRTGTVVMEREMQGRRKLA